MSPILNYRSIWRSPLVEEHDYYLALLCGIAEAFGFDINTPWYRLTELQREIILYGTDTPILVPADSRYRKRDYYRQFQGVIPILERQYRETTSEAYKQKLEEYQVNQTCPACGGQRLKPAALAVRLGQYRLTDLTSVSIRECLARLRSLQLSARQQQIAELALREVTARLQFLVDVGLDYLTLDRSAATLSGGEAQRIRLATQIGSGLTGVLYVLDEPSIGLHQRDNDRLLQTLFRLRDLGNTLIVVEHDEDTIRAADHIVDITRGGIYGGQIVAQGSLEAILNHPDSLTGAYLSGRKRIETPAIAGEWSIPDSQTGISQ